MYYEVYIDVLFLVNLVLDYLLLSVTARLLKCTATHLRIFLGSLVGAFGYCLFFVLPIPAGALKILLLHGAVGSLMVWIGLRPRKAAAFLKCLVSMYLGAFLLGGVIGWLYPYIGGRLLGNFLLLSALSYAVICLILKTYDYFRDKRTKFCRAVLFNGGRKQIVGGLLDTGNCLKDPVTGQRVHVTDYEAVKGLFGETELKELLSMYEYRNEESAAATHNFRYIPFRSVGKAHGLLPAITIDQITICLEEREVVQKNPVIMVSKDKLSTRGNYRIIINTEGLH